MSTNVSNIDGLDLGHSKAIQSISSGRALPSMTEFLSICDYLEISPKIFFDDGIDNPTLQEAVDGLKQQSDAKLILSNINRLLK